MSGAFIVIEGLEGAGKSTVICAVSEYIKNKGHDVLCTREPGGTPMAEAIRNCVKQDWSTEEVTQETELLLMYAARSQLVHNVIKPALNQGHYVVGDRHNLSSLAYQGGGRQVPDITMSQLKTMTLGSFSPNFTLYLDIEPKLGLSRARGRGELDRIEMAGIAFFDRARERYLAEIKTMQQENAYSAAIIDASQDVDSVRESVLNSLDAWYSEFHHASRS